MDHIDRYRRQLVLDAPSGDVCACGQIHDSAEQEAECDGSDNPLGLASTQQLVAGSTQYNELVSLFHEGMIDADEIRRRFPKGDPR